MWISIQRNDAAPERKPGCRPGLVERVRGDDLVRDGTLPRVLVEQSRERNAVDPHVRVLGAP
jgi:hypothetical protein